MSANAWNAAPGELGSDWLGCPAATCEHCGDLTSARNRYRTVRAGVELRGFTLASGSEITICGECYGQFARDVEDMR